MKRIVSTLAAVASLTLLAPVSAEAGFVGLYYRGAADKLSVSLKDGTPVLKLEIAHAPDIPECSGFQFFRRNPPTGELRIIEGPGGEKGTGFGLWQSSRCREELQARCPVRDNVGRRAREGRDEGPGDAGWTDGEPPGRVLWASPSLRHHPREAAFHRGGGACGDHESRQEGHRGQLLHGEAYGGGPGASLR